MPTVADAEEDYVIGSVYTGINFGAHDGIPEWEWIAGSPDVIRSVSRIWIPKHSRYRRRPDG